MAIVARTTGRSVEDAPQAVGTEELRKLDTSAAFGAIGATDTLNSGREIQEIAQKEVTALEARDRTRMMAELSEFEIESIQRVNVFESEGTGDKPFVKGVMEDTAERAKEFIEQQPEFLRGETALRLLPIQTKVAKSAVATQQIRIDNENLESSETFRNATVNQVRYGQLDEKLALAKSDSFIDKLPEHMRAAEREKATDQIRTASLKAQMQADPEATIEAVEAGKFNDIPSTSLESVYAAGVRAVEAEKNKVKVLKKKAQDLSSKDPAQAALLYWQALDVTNPTREELLFAQAELNIPEADRSVITINQAQNVVRQMSAVQNVDEFMLLQEEFKAQAATGGGTIEELVEDVSKLASMPMSLRLIIGVDQAIIPQEFLAGAIDTIRSPKAGEDARKQITSRALVGALETGSKKIEVLEGLVFGAAADELEAMVKSGVSVRAGEGTTREFVQSLKDISAITYNNAEAIGENGEDAVEKMLGARGETQEVRVNGADGYVLPLDLAELVSEKDMDALRVAAMRDLRVITSTTGTSFPTEDFARTAMEINSGWTMYGNRSLILRSYGMPVLREREDGTVEHIIITFDQLAVRKRGRGE